MKNLERVTVIVFVAVLAVFIGVKAYTRMVVDTTPPQISCDTDTIDISVADPESVLLQGVTAKDDRDGDLTGSIMVKGVTNLLSGNTARVSYIVFDSSNNMATCQRTIRYTDYEKPRFALSQPRIYPEGGPVMVLDKLSAADSAGEDISGNISIVSQNIDIYTAGRYFLTAQVSNSQGDIESVTLPVIISSAKKQLVELKEYLVYIDQGAGFNSGSYVSSVKDSSGAAYDTSHLSVEGQVDTSVPGTYYVSYSFQTCTVILTVVVR